MVFVVLLFKCNGNIIIINKNINLLSFLGFLSTNC